MDAAKGMFPVQGIIGYQETKDHSYEYRVHWAGYLAKDGTWEPPSHVVPGCRQLVERYHRTVRSWGGNIELIHDRRPRLRYQPEGDMLRARYLVQWEGWDQGEKDWTWEELMYDGVYDELIDDWYERQQRPAGV